MQNLRTEETSRQYNIAIQALINYYMKSRLQNSPYFSVFKYARAVKQKVWNET